MSTHSLDSQNFLPTLIELVPELETLFKEHVKFYQEPMPNIFLGNLARIVTDSVKALEDKRSARLEVILDMIDKALSSEDDALRIAGKVAFVDSITDLGTRTAIRAYEKLALNEELEARWNDKN